MISIKKLFAKGILATLVFYPQVLTAGGFTGADVLRWEKKAQDSYFQTSVTMIAIVATQTGEHGAIAKCIDDWYGGGDASQPQRSARIRKVMKSLPGYHPQAVILAVIEKECGKFQKN